MPCFIYCSLFFLGSSRRHTSHLLLLIVGTAYEGFFKIGRLGLLGVYKDAVQEHSSEEEVRKKLGLPYWQFRKKGDKTQANWATVATVPKQYTVINRVPGENLKVFLNKHELNDTEKLELAAKIVEKVRNLHDNEILHRDLNPENIMVDLRPDGISVDLVDLQTAKFFEKPGVINDIDGVKTEHYAAPEVEKVNILKKQMVMQ